MYNRLIPHAAWFSYFRDFTRRHPRWPTTVWLLGPQIGAQVEVRDLSLQGITADPLATSITIQLGGTLGRNVEHAVAKPISVWAEMNEEGEEAALGINSEDGSTTLLEFRQPRPVRATDVLPCVAEPEVLAAV